ncbi:unnamed protein product [Amoebophrya sp. A120]|nr:unnamed protein product [Amoebophrya sp. A120]|eukprot:GSA120T00010493001.1
MLKPSNFVAVAPDGETKILFHFLELVDSFFIYISDVRDVGALDDLHVGLPPRGLLLPKTTTGMVPAVQHAKKILDTGNAGGVDSVKMARAPAEAETKDIASNPVENVLTPKASSNPSNPQDQHSPKPAPVSSLFTGMKFKIKNLEKQGSSCSTEYPSQTTNDLQDNNFISAASSLHTNLYNPNSGYSTATDGMKKDPLKHPLSKVLMQKSKSNTLESLGEEELPQLGRENEEDQTPNGTNTFDRTHSVQFDISNSSIGLHPMGTPPCTRTASHCTSRLSVGVSRRAASPRAQNMNMQEHQQLLANSLAKLKINEHVLQMEHGGLQLADEMLLQAGGATGAVDSEISAKSTTVGTEVTMTGFPGDAEEEESASGVKTGPVLAEKNAQDLRVQKKSSLLATETASAASSSPTVDDLFPQPSSCVMGSLDGLGGTLASQLALFHKKPMHVSCNLRGNCQDSSSEEYGNMQLFLLEQCRNFLLKQRGDNAVDNKVKEQESTMLEPKCSSQQKIVEAARAAAPQNRPPTVLSTLDASGAGAGGA